jgi:hypothetical protein
MAAPPLLKLYDRAAGVARQGPRQGFFAAENGRSRSDFNDHAFVNPNHNTA